MQKGLEIEAMRESAGSIVNVLKSLANTDRLIILCHLAIFNCLGNCILILKLDHFFLHNVFRIL